MTDRLRALARVVAQQALLRDRANVAAARFDADMQALAAKDRALRESAEGADSLADILLPLVARRLTQVAQDRAALERMLEDTRARARQHERLARAAHTRATRMRAAIDDVGERARLEEIAGHPVGQFGARTPR